MKNAGKTTVLNSLIPAFSKKTIGLTSIGMDGEAFDNVTFLPKPRVMALPGFLVATAEKCLDVFEADYDIVETTKYRSPLGQIVIARIIKAGNVLIAGPSAIVDMENTIKRMLEIGADKVFIDGAFSRQSPARLATATILVIGANRSVVLETVLKDAEAIVHKLRLEAVESNLMYLKDHTKITAIDNLDNIHEYDGGSTLIEPESVIAWVQPGWGYLYVPNAVGASFLKLMLKDKAKKFILVMNDPISMQIDDSLVKHIEHLSKRIRVMNPVNLVAVCVNPQSVRGYAYQEGELEKALANRLGLEVINVMTEVGEIDE
ncbi:MAG: hypothetical protein PHI01_00960 [Candidatus Izemoplasmatales bacterium]|nr:hypothetical protein [Candidatus Izemoplasmatales bacterium]